jgi:hypothetical protein
VKARRFLAGTIRHEDINCTFQVWAYQKLTKKQVWRAHRIWARERDRRFSLKGMTIHCDYDPAKHGVKE